MTPKDLQSNSLKSEETGQQDGKEKKRSWTPRVITGGKGPTEPPGEGINWLAEYDAGTTFVCRHKNSNEVDLNLYHVVYKHLPEVVLLAWRLPDGKMLDVYVDPERFSKNFEKPTILGIQPVANEEDDDDQEQRDNLRSRDVVLHEAVQGVDQVVSGSEEPDLPD